VFDASQYVDVGTRDIDSGDTLQALDKAAASCCMSPLVRELQTGDSIEPRKDLVTTWHLVDLSPRHQEGLRDRIVYQMGFSAAGAVGPDVPLVTTVKIGES
jgi:hypothetical protein